MKNHNKLTLLWEVEDTVMLENQKIGKCETCEDGSVMIVYSPILGIWQCEGCDDCSAEVMWYGD